MQLFKFGLVVVSMGGTVYTLSAWKEMSLFVRALAVVLLIMTFVAAIPGFMEGLSYLSGSRITFTFGSDVRTIILKTILLAALFAGVWICFLLGLVSLNEQDGWVLMIVCVFFALIFGWVFQDIFLH